jgi:hypothetical protein
MNKKRTEKEVLAAIINGYREVVKKRYEYEALQEKYELPASFTKERVELFSSYFLEYIYPNLEKRAELEEAFDSLDDYIKQPSKLLRILLDSGRLLFKYGRHLPKILKAGLKALNSFRTATQFENKLVQKAQALEVEMPYSTETINQLISALPRYELETFIDNSQALFETLHDRVLVQKILEIVAYLIAKMKEKPDVYTPMDIKGLAIGQAIIKNGDALFNQLTKEDQAIIFDVIIKIERDVLTDLYA